MATKSVELKPKQGRGSRARSAPVDAISPAHDAFCCAVAEGVMPVWAYKAHIAETDTAYNELCTGACLLLKRAHIQARIAAIRTSFRDVMEKKLGVTQETMGRYLLEFIQAPPDSIGKDSQFCNGIVPGKFGDKLEIPSKLEAIKIYNAMCGYNAPEKKEVTLNAHEDVEEALAGWWKKEKGEGK